MISLCSPIRIAIKLLNSISQYPGFAAYWKSRFKQVAEGLDAWDYIWTLSCWAADGVTCIPHVNLVSNIGFGKDSTHCPDANSQWANLKAHEIESPLRHPLELNDRYAGR